MRNRIKKTVYQVLQEDIYARQDDNYLILKVISILEPDLIGDYFYNVMTRLKYKSISFEGITRARRKFFEEYPELKEEKAEKARRKKEEEYYLEYGNHIPRID